MDALLILLAALLVAVIVFLHRIHKSIENLPIYGLPSDITEVRNDVKQIRETVYMYPLLNLPEQFHDLSTKLDSIASAIDGIRRTLIEELDLPRKRENGEDLFGDEG